MKTSPRKKLDTNMATTTPAKIFWRTLYALVERWATWQEASMRCSGALLFSRLQRGFEFRDYPVRDSITAFDLIFVAAINDDQSTDFLRISVCVQLHVPAAV